VATRCATAASCERTSVKCAESPCATMAVIAAQRWRIVAGARRRRTASFKAAPLAPDSFKPAPLHRGELCFVGHGTIGEVASRDLGFDLDARVGRHQRIGDL